MRAQWNEITLPTAVIRHQYDADHALEVHEGAEFFGPTPTIYSRPWVEVTLREVDFAEMVAEQARKAPDSGRISVGLAIHEAFYLANEELGELFGGALLDERWFWPNETQRQNGEVAGSPRDIFDTGELFNSYSMRAVG